MKPGDKVIVTQSSPMGARHAIKGMVCIVLEVDGTNYECIMPPEFGNSGHSYIYEGRRHRAYYIPKYAAAKFYDDGINMGARAYIEAEIGK